MSEFGFAGGSSDDAINLSMGLDTTGGLGSFEPVPEGAHRFQVAEPPAVDYTKSGETMLVLKLKVVESHIPNAIGKIHTERIVIPGSARFQEDNGKWQTMMKMLRGKLEAMTGREWRSDNVQLRPRELGGCEFVAIVKHKPRTYVGTDGISRDTVDVDLTNWQSIIKTTPVGNGALVDSNQMAQQVQQTQQSPTAFRL